jgi:hypothetical protein
MLCAAFLCSPVYATTMITVADLGTILNESISFPSTKMPGNSKAFADYFEFYLPKGEYVSASVSVSGPQKDQIPAGMGSLILANWITTGPAPHHIPGGSVIEQATISPPAGLGGQSAYVGAQTPFGDYEPAGHYFVEVSGISGVGNLKLAVDGNVTAAVPEMSTWGMFGVGFAGIGLLGFAKRRREVARYAF